MLSRVIPINNKYLLLLISLICVCSYQMRYASHPDAAQAQAQAVPGAAGNINKFFIDKDGNEIPVFDENTLYPKPSGGYCNMTAIKDKEEFFQAVEIPRVECKDLQTKGLYQVCLDGFVNKDNCVVLSFGISYDFKYEDALIDGHGCQAYSFDPTMAKDRITYERKNGKDKFYDLGLSSFKGVKIITYQERKDLSCKVDRYVNIVKMLDLVNTKIDFFKIDIEGSELDFFLDTASNHPELLENIQQLQLELHNMEDLSQYHSGNRKDTSQFDMMKIVQILRCHGFAMVHTRWNPAKFLHFMYNGKERSLCYVTTWIRHS